MSPLLLRPRGRAHTESGAPSPEKKRRGRKPGLLLKKTLANQKRKLTRASRASAPRHILVLLLLALPLPLELEDRDGRARGRDDERYDRYGRGGRMEEDEDDDDDDTADADDDTVDDNGDDNVDEDSAKVEKPQRQAGRARGQNPAKASRLVTIPVRAAHTPSGRSSRARLALLTPTRLPPATRLPPPSSPGAGSSDTDRDGFVEPALAPPTPGYLGFPLEALPPPRAPGRRGAKRTRVSPAPEPAVEDAYRRRLATQRLESLTTASHERTHVAPPPPKRRSTARAAPPTPTRLRVRRAKPASPRKPAFLGGAVAVTPPEDAADNDDYCGACGGSGVFICCESCPRLFHLLCCEPPLRDVPVDSWSCRECRAAQGMVARRLWSELGMFGPLVNATHARNAAEFRLPRRLRDATFEGVATGADHAYTDSHAKTEMRPTRLHLLAGYNRNDDLDVDALYDRTGRAHLCHRCGMLGLGRRTLMACDYCPLYWHLDCLREPMALAKTLGLKWRCPNHVESLLPPGWAPRALRDTAVVDAALHAHFLRVWSASRFVVHHDDQPYLADRTPLLHEYLAWERGDFVANASAFVDRARGGTESDGDSDTDVNFRVPDFLQNYAVDGRVVARASRRLARVLLMTNADDPDQRPFVYRVPEKLVLLDFLSSGSSKRGVMRDLDAYEDLARAEDEREDAVVAGLAQLSRPRLDFDELVLAAVGKASACADDHTCGNGRVENSRGDEISEDTGVDSGSAHGVSSSAGAANDLASGSDYNFTSNGELDLASEATFTAGSSADNGATADNGSGALVVCADSAESISANGHANGNLVENTAEDAAGDGDVIDAREAHELRQIRRLMQLKGRDELLAFLRA